MLICVLQADDTVRMKHTVGMNMGRIDYRRK